MADAVEDLAEEAVLEGLVLHHLLEGLHEHRVLASQPQPCSHPSTRLTIVTMRPGMVLEGLLIVDCNPSL